MRKTQEDLKRMESAAIQKFREEPWGKLLIAIGFEPYNTESAARQVAHFAVNEIKNLRNALRPFVESFDNHPGISDLDNDQPITVRVKLGEWRRARAELARENGDGR